MAKKRLKSEPVSLEDPRPVWRGWYQFHFPLNAWLSIAHRICGLISVIFLLSGLIILNVWILSPLHFAEINGFWQSFWGRLWLWLGLSALLYHWLAGLRHLLMEHEIGLRFLHPQLLLKLYGIAWLLLSWEVWR